MPKVLYNKYRSSDFDQLIGQEHISKILKNAVKNNKISHAYLFVGSRGTGKTSTARILSKALNCLHLKDDGNPCCECQNCLAITQGRFMDLIEIDAASNRGIDQIRELKEKLEFSPVEGKYKIYIVDEVHMLTKEAFNALLKTLEEPPAHVIFMLATTDVHKLPPTILSRCQRYDFRLGSDTEIKSVLANVSKQEGVTLEDGALKILVEGAHGSFRDGLSLLDAVVSGQLTSEKPEVVSEAEVRKILGIPDTTMVYLFLECLVTGDGKQALKLIEELESKGVNLHQFLKYNLDMLQDILIKKISQTWNDTEYSFANSLNQSQVTAIIALFLNSEKNLRMTSIPSLILEMLIVQVASLNLGTKKTTVEKESVKPTLPEKKTVIIAQANKVEEVKKEEVKQVIPEVSKEVETHEEEEEEEVESTNQSTIAVTFENIRENWSKVIEAIKPASGHLFAFLDSSKLIDFSNQTLKLEVPFEFHKDRIESVGSREAIGNVLNKIFGTSFRVECTVNGNTIKKRKVSSDIVMQNIPKPEVEKTTAPAANNGKSYQNNGEPRKVSKKIEAIFEGM